MKNKCGKLPTEADIEALRVKVKPYLTEKRYLHVLAVEREAAILGEIYLPCKITELRASALLHDITKKNDLEKQLKYCAEFGIIISKYDKLSPKIFHAKTAAALIGRDFPEFDTAEIVSGVRWHTTGHDGMTLFEAIIYLADYIEDTRTFPACTELRRFFYDGLSSGRDKKELLYETMVMSFDKTICDLIGDGSLIDTDTVQARSFYLQKLAELGKRS